MNTETKPTVKQLAYKYRRRYQDQAAERNGGMNDNIMFDAMHREQGFEDGFNAAGEGNLIIDLACMRSDRSEGSYYYSWQANIAMAFKDEFDRYLEKQVGLLSTQDVHIIANNAAQNFLDMLINTK